MEGGYYFAYLFSSGLTKLLHTTIPALQTTGIDAITAPLTKGSLIAKAHTASAIASAPVMIPDTRVNTFLLIYVLLMDLLRAGTQL